MKKTLRLKMAQWQGGNLPQYYLGPQILSMLAPKGENTIEREVPIKKPDGNPLDKEDGLVARSILMDNIAAANTILDEENPDRIVVFGGDCLVSQAPFAYLNKKYDGNLGVLWLDAHPDLSNTEMYYHGHAMVLGNLLGAGDAGLASTVEVKVKPEMVMYGGLMETTPQEAEWIEKLSLRHCGPEALVENSDLIIEWIKQNNIRHLAVHLDLDVMDVSCFKSLMFTKPEPDHWQIDAPSGKMTFLELTRIFKDVSANTEIVGLTIAEYFPWDCMNLQDFMGALNIFK